MKQLKKLKKILKEMEGAAPTNSVAAHGTSIAGASPGEMPPVNLKKKRIPDFPKLRRNKPSM